MSVLASKPYMSYVRVKYKVINTMGTVLAVHMNKKMTRRTVPTVLKGGDS